MPSINQYTDPLWTNDKSSYYTISELQGAQSSFVNFLNVGGIPAVKLLGRYTNSSGYAQEISIGTGLLLNSTTGILTATNNGTVTSVGLSMPSIFSVTSSPVTTSGTFNVTLTSQSTGTVFAAPSGSSGIPGFRSLVESDIPSLTSSKISNFVSTVRTSLSAGTGISYDSGTGIITNTGITSVPNWQSTLGVSNISTGITPVTDISPTLNASLYSSGNFEARSSTYPSIGFHRPGNAGMALYLGDIDQSDLRIRTSSNTDYKIYHDGYAPIPTLAQVTAVGNTTPSSVAIGSGAGNGYVTISPAVGATGWIGFYKPDTTRLGYIGSNTIDMSYVAENSARHIFSGGRIISQGSLHVGTDNPNFVLSAQGSASAGNAHTYINNTNGAADTYGLVIDITATDALSFPLIARGDNGNTVGLAVTANGRVGIGGTTTPATSLHVSGIITSSIGLYSETGSDLTLWAQNGGSMNFYSGNSTLKMALDNGGNLCVGGVPNSARASVIQAEGNVWSTDAYILGLGSTPIGEFGLDSDVFVRTMGSQNLNFKTNNNIQRAQINASTGNLILENQIQIKGGTPGVGKVLTSDSSGLATWTTPGAGTISSVIYTDGTYTLDATVSYVTTNGTSNGSVVLNVPSATGNAGKIIFIIKMSSSSYTLAGTGITQRMCVLVCDGSNWLINAFT